MAYDQAKLKEAKELYDKAGFPNLLEADKVKYILCLEALGDKAKAENLSQKIRESSSEAACLFAGRLKRNYLDRRKAADYQQALDWYTKGLTLATKKEETYYAAINLSFINLLNGDSTESKDCLLYTSPSPRDS